MKMIKCFQITPSSDSSYDSMIVQADNTWQPALQAVEDALESAFLKCEDEGLPWTDIKVEVKCVEMTQEDFDIICDN